MGYRSILVSMALLASLQGAQSSLMSGSGSNVAVYWGQGGGQSLSSYCSDDNIDVLILAFIDNFDSSGYPELNFAGSSTNIGPQISQCQQQGKTVLLSAGGWDYHGGWISPAQAATSATKVWEMFGPDQGTRAKRPFGDAVVDGFDFDFEHPTSNLLSYATKLRQLMDAESSKQYYMTAAPQCSFPDKNMGQLLNAGLMDAIWVQFYNNAECGIPSGYQRRAGIGAPFNLDTWTNWALQHVAKDTVSNMTGVTHTSRRKTQVYIGLVAGQSEAPSGGYVMPNLLPPVIDYAKTLPNFGGVMIWEASGTRSNPSLLPTVKKALTAGLLPLN